MPDEPADIAAEAGIPIEDPHKMLDAAIVAADIVRDKRAADTEANVKYFLDSYEPGENPVARVLAWDHRLMVVGHSANRAACVATSAVVQTIAAVARNLHSAQKVQRYETEKGEPVYDIVLREGARSRKLIAAALASLAGVAKTAERDNPGSAMELMDHRKTIPNAAANTRGR